MRYNSMIDKEKEYGIVLEGGGAKGAYQIGVWKALKEYGIKIKGIAGVSVGALNGALICMDDVEVAEHIWSNITYSQVMKVNNEQMDKLLHGDIKSLKIASLTMNSAKAVVNGGIDITPLRELMEEYINEDKIINSPMELIIGTLSVSQLREMEIDVKDLLPGEIKDYLIASSALPVFKQEKVQGRTYLDGGMTNNVPIDMLLKRGYKDIIVIRIFGIGLEKRVKVPDDVNIIEIYPRVELGNILDFNGNRAKRNLRIGYYDALRVIHNLQGKIYYIDQVRSEEEHCRCFMEKNTMAIMALLEFFKEDYSNRANYTRKLYEVILPLIAEKLGLSKSWTYTELYLSMLELSAKTLKVLKYKLYTEDQFLEEIKSNYEKHVVKLIEETMFIQLIVKFIVI